MTPVDPRSNRSSGPMDSRDTIIVFDADRTTGDRFGWAVTEVLGVDTLTAESLEAGDEPLVDAHLEQQDGVLGPGQLREPGVTPDCRHRRRTSASHGGILQVGAASGPRDTGGTGRERLPGVGPLPRLQRRRWVGPARLPVDLRAGLPCHWGVRARPAPVAREGVPPAGTRDRRGQGLLGRRSRWLSASVVARQHRGSVCLGAGTASTGRVTPRS